MLAKGVGIAIAIMCVSLPQALAVTGNETTTNSTPGKVATPIDRGKFKQSIVIDNKWAPMKPGTRWTYQGTSQEDDGKIVPHRITVTITDLTKTVAGVRTVVSYDLDYSDGELVEAELAFYAQDDDRNVWQFGEYPEEYEDGKFIKAPAWIHGLQGARAGITMPANPEMGTEAYSEGWGPAVGWRDRGTVYQVDQKVTVAAGAFEHVLVIKESAAGEKDAEQLKYYAPGIGNVRTGWPGSNAKTTETLELVSIEHLDRKALQEINQKALRLEASAYKRRTSVYSNTAHSVFTSNLGAATR